MKVLVTGALGMLGTDLTRELAGRGFQVIGTDLQPASPDLSCEYVPLDLTDSESVKKALRKIRPEAVIHCASWTAVDAAEEPENRALVEAVNVGGTVCLAEICAELDSKLMFISTDYVFDGTGTEPLKPEQVNYAPLNVYGRTKLAGEQAVAEHLSRHFIVRIAWAFGTNGKNFVQTMLRVGKTYDTVRVVNDQIGTPTYTPHLARLLGDMILTDRYGIYHVTNEGGYLSWYDFCKAIYEEAGMNVTVLPVSTAEYGLSKAARPFNSRLDKSKLKEMGFRPLPHWREALKEYIENLKREEKLQEG